MFIGLLTDLVNSSNHTKTRIFKQSKMLDSTYSY